MDIHQRLSGALVFVFGLAGFLLMAVLALPFLAAGRTGGPLDASTPVLLGIFFGLLLLVWGLAAVVGGLAAAYGAPWGGKLAVPAAFPMLLFIPFGTFAGLYVLWSFWRKEAVRPPPAWKRIAMKTR